MRSKTFVEWKSNRKDEITSNKKFKKQLILKNSWEIRRDSKNNTIILAK
jgi:hypothetical protein